MNRRIAATFATAALGLGLTAGPAFAGIGRVESKGSCSAASTYRLRVEPIVAKNITRFQGKVDSGIAGEVWHVVARDNGTVVFERDVVTRLNGELQRSGKVAGTTGHTIQFDATNPATGETCSASASV